MFFKKISVEASLKERDNVVHAFIRAWAQKGLCRKISFLIYSCYAPMAHAMLDFFLDNIFSCNVELYLTTCICKCLLQGKF